MKDMVVIERYRYRVQGQIQDLDEGGSGQGGAKGMPF